MSNTLNILKAMATGLANTSAILLLVYTNSLYQWIKFIPKDIQLSTYIYIGAICFFIFFIAFAIMYSINNRSECNAKKTLSSIGKFLKKDFIITNIIFLLLCSSFVSYLFLSNQVDLLFGIQQYFIFGFIAANTWALFVNFTDTGSELLRKVLSILIIAGALIGATYLYNDDSLENICAIIIVSAILVAAVCIYTKSNSKDNPNNETIGTPSRSNISLNKSIACFLLNTFVYGITGIVLAYQYPDIEDIKNFTVPLAIAFFITLFNTTAFLCSNNLLHTHNLLPQQLPPESNSGEITLQKRQT